MIPGVEKAVPSMERRDAATVTIPAEYPYGPKDAGSMMLVERANLPQDVDIELGMRMQGQRGNGATAVFTLDGSHPLAGRDLTFETELVEII
ncbi:MAG: FKBP-type peptidyl-prolyl cis-trans isomerase [Chloroflexi bacterium]|nr:FKBP-type peptidyl-prolyl cis-trans isomerase [Chloroflexota bacterium]